MLNSDPSVSLRLHKGKYKFSVICTFTTPTSFVSYTLRTLWILLRSFGGDIPIPETTTLLCRAGLDPTHGSKHPHWRSRGGGSCLKGGCSKAAARERDPPEWSGSPGGSSSCLGSAEQSQQKSWRWKSCLMVKPTNLAIISGSGQPLAEWGMSDMPDPPNLSSFLPV